MAILAKVNFTNSSQAADTFGSWTNLVTGALNTTANILVFDGGADTGWDITVTIGTIQGPDGVNAVGTGDAAWVDEATISDTYHFVVGASEGQYTISGLDNSKTYTIKVFCSRDSTSGSIVGEYSTDGFTTFLELNASLNSTQIVTLSNISPSSGNIVIDWRNKDDAGAAYFNAIEIVENDVGGTTTNISASFTAIGGISPEKQIDKIVIFSSLGSFTAAKGLELISIVPFSSVASLSSSAEIVLSTSASMSGSGGLSVVKTILKSIGFSGVGTKSTVKQIEKEVGFSSVGTVSSSEDLVSTVDKSFSAVGSLTKLVTFIAGIPIVKQIKGVILKGIGIIGKLIKGNNI